MASTAAHPTRRLDGQTRTRNPSPWPHPRRPLGVFSYTSILSVQIAEQKILAAASIFWSHRADLNRRPLLYESIALPTELRWRGDKIVPQPPKMVNPLLEIILDL